MTALALSRRELDAQRAGSALPFLTRRRVARFLLAFVDLSPFERAERKVLDALASVTLAEDLPVVLDELDAALGPEKAAIASLLRSQRARLLLRLAASLAPRSAADLGLVVDARVREGFAYLDEVERVMRERPMDARDSGEGVAALSVYDPELPVELAEAMLLSGRTLPALLALAGGKRAASGLAPWLLRELATAFRDGAFASLRLVAASFPSARISAELLPHEERIDVAAATERNRATRAAWQELPITDSTAQ